MRVFEQVPGDGGVGSSSAALAGAAPAAPAPSPAPAWIPGADEELVGFLSTKGWTEPKQVVDGYRNLEKLFGADRAGNTVVLPKPDAAPADWNSFYDRLGRPADAAGYKVEVPEGGSKEFAAAAAGKFHELGLTAKQGEALSAWWNETAGSTATAAAAASAAAFQADEVALKTEWGAAYTQNLAAAQAASRGLGLDNETIDKLSGALGHKATMQLLQSIGSKTLEPGFAAAGVSGFGSAMTPGEAKVRITGYMSDKNFVARYVGGDAAAVAEMKKLHEFAYPEGT